MKLLIAGESWQTLLLHIKGFDPFFNGTYETGVEQLRQSLVDADYAVDYLPNHEAGVGFPTTMSELEQYDLVILSDIGSNTLLLHPDTFAKSQRRPNRLKLLREYVENGGGLLMIGGYLTFQGIDGKGRWHDTPVEDVLPVTISPYDDRQEIPEGIVPEVVGNHPILDGIAGPWPWLLGYNKTVAKPEAEVLLTIEDAPLLAVMEYGKGKTAAFTSDCAPHWCPPEFVDWTHYSKLWAQLAAWLTNQQL